MDWYLAPSLARLRSQVTRKWPDRATASDGTIGDAAHRAQGTASDHNPDPKTGVVRAIDFTVNTSQGQALLEATWKDPRVWYVIWRSQIYFHGETSPRPYSGINAHASHIHISINRNDPSAETDVTNWKGLGMPQMVSPAEGRVSSEWSPRRRHPVSGVIQSHAGIDIANRIGTPIYAAYAGEVVGVGTNGVPGRTGNYVLIKNPDGEHQYYGHLSRALVSTGQKVKAGDLIAEMGASGNVTGPHLHFEVWSNQSPGSHRNPRIDFNYHGVTPGSKPQIGDWFDMATKKDLEDVIWGVLSSHNVNISGTTKRALGVDKRSAFSLLRYAAAALFEGREQHADLVAQNRALTAAVETLATSQGLDPADVTDTINQAVSEALAGLEVTLSVSRDEDLED